MPNPSRPPQARDVRHGHARRGRAAAGAWWCPRPPSRRSTASPSCSWRTAKGRYRAARRRGGAGARAARSRSDAGVRDGRARRRRRQRSC
ncbi:MAG: hypothetical protein MZV64_43300 [Ignavibacteriales bacterium]|nr:hypothetical protein [Ignavibacteriales bacterium]